MSVNLENFRNEINNIDEELLNLLARRMQVSVSVGKYKKENNITILNSKREEEVIQKVVSLSHSKTFLDMNEKIISIDDNFIESIWKNIMDYSKTLQN